MVRRRVAFAVALAALVSGCGDGGDTAAQDRATPTSVASAGGGDPSCPQKALTLTTDERWQATPAETTTANGVTGALWRATFTFGNPNNVDVALTFPTIVLDILGPDGHHRSNGKTTPHEPEGVVTAGGARETTADVLMVPGHIPKTLSVYAVTSARGASGNECTVAIQGASPPRPPSELQNVKDCEPRTAPAAC